MRIFLKTEDEINLIRAASQLLSCALIEVGRDVVPKVALSYLRSQVKDKVAETVRQFVSESISSFCENTVPQLGLSFFVDGAYVAKPLESVIILEKGSLLTVDCWMRHKGYYSYAAHTYCVGDGIESNPFMSKIQCVVKHAVGKAVAGHPVQDISAVFQSHKNLCSFDLRKPFVHGIGRAKIESPKVRNTTGFTPNFLLKEGMVLAIAPTITDDKKPTITARLRNEASLQHPFKPFGTTLVVRLGHPEILTSLSNISLFKKDN